MEMGDRKITMLSVTADNGYSVSGCLNWEISDASISKYC